MSGVQRILKIDHPDFQHLLAEPVALLLTKIMREGNYDYLIAPSNTDSKNILPRIAAQLDVMQLSDVLQILGHDQFTRPIYAGNAIETIQSLDPIKIITIRATLFNACDTTGQAEIIAISPTIEDHSLSQFVQQITKQQDHPDLSSAKIIIAGGRAFETAENFENILYPLAAKLNAAIGASRAAVDSGFASNDLQIGQTGKMVAPDLYIAIGISGAIQHISGICESRVIVAINKDPHAPIFDVADYGLVGDLFEVIPQIHKIL